CAPCPVARWHARAPGTPPRGLHCAAAPAWAAIRSRASRSLGLIRSRGQLRREKGLEVAIRLVRRFFRKEVTTVEGAAADVVRPLPPDGKHVIPTLQRPLPAPEREYGASNPPPASIGLVVLMVQGGRGPVLLADRVERLGIAEAPRVLDAHLLR